MWGGDPTVDVLILIGIAPMMIWRESAWTSMHDQGGIRSDERGVEERSDEHPGNRRFDGREHPGQGCQQRTLRPQPFAVAATLARVREHVGRLTGGVVALLLNHRLMARYPSGMCLKITVETMGFVPRPLQGPGGRLGNGMGSRRGGWKPTVFGMANAELVIALNESGAISRRGYLLRISNRQFPNKFQIQDQISTAEARFHIRNRE